VMVALTAALDKIISSQFGSVTGVALILTPDS
jgi:hypothetical protein